MAVGGVLGNLLLVTICYYLVFLEFRYLHQEQFEHKQANKQTDKQHDERLKQTSKKKNCNCKIKCSGFVANFVVIFALICSWFLIMLWFLLNLFNIIIKYFNFQIIFPGTRTMTTTTMTNGTCGKGPTVGIHPKISTGGASKTKYF